MTIHLRPDLEAALKTQVDLGNFPSIEAALEAAIQGLTTTFEAESESESAWVKPYLDAADKAIAAGQTHSEVATFADLEKRFGKL